LNNTHKNIIIVGSAYPLRGGGITTFNERLAHEFQNKGNKVTIFTFSLQYPGFLFPGTTQYSTEAPPADLNIRVCINSINPINWLLVGNKIKKLNPDLIVVRYWLPFMGPCLGTILRIVKQNKKTRIVCIADNIIPHEKRLGDLPFTKYFLKSVDACITMSEQVLKDLKQISPNMPAKFVAHPLYDNFGEKINKSTARKVLKIDDNISIVLFFGFIRKYKGLDILFEAISMLKKSNYLNGQIKFLIAGEFYEDRKTYDDLITQLSIQDELILHTDFIPDSEVKNYLCAADVVIQPYRSATQSGVTPLAYHFEVPMIVTNVGGLPALVPHEKVGWVSEPDASAIANSIQQFFADNPNRFLPGLIEEKKKYSWDVMANEIMSS
jgi:glycosyltransferase involved in cell wall biosynthesis